MKIVFKVFDIIYRIYSIFSTKTEVTLQKLDDTFKVFNGLLFLSILGGIFGLLEILNISNVFDLVVFPILIIVFSLIVYVYSKNKTEGVSVTVSTSRVITELYKSHDEMIEVIGVIMEVDATRDQGDDPEEDRKLRN